VLAIIEFLGRPPSPVVPEVTEPEHPADIDGADVSGDNSRPVMTGSHTLDNAEADTPR